MVDNSSKTKTMFSKIEFKLIIGFFFRKIVKSKTFDKIFTFQSKIKVINFVF